MNTNTNTNEPPLVSALTPYRVATRDAPSSHWQRVGLKYGLSTPNQTYWFRVVLPHGAVTFGLLPTTDGDSNTWILHSIVADPRGAGVGSASLRILCDVCDRVGATLRLRAMPGRGSLMVKNELTQWYASFGFRFNTSLQPQQKVLMERAPNPIANKQQASVNRGIICNVHRRGTGMSVNDKVMVIAATTPPVDWRALAKTITKNPTKWANGVTKAELVKAMRYAAETYYNSGTYWISDAAFDDLFDVLKIRDPNNPQLTRVGAVDPKAKAALPFYMPSLDKKKKGEDIDAWSVAFDHGAYVLSDKVDGVSLLLHYRGGKPDLYTRGDGRTGRNVSHLVEFLDIPVTKKKLVVRAEIIMPKSRFDKFAAFSENPDSFNLRNFAAGLINRTAGKSPELAHAKVVAYEIIEPKMTPSKQFKTLKAMGFTVPANTVVPSVSFDTLSAFLKKRKANSKYEIDGLVVTADFNFTRTVSGNPNYSFAFKETTSEDLAQATVLSIAWQASRHGFLKPVIQIEPIKLGGVMVKRVTAHNGKVVWDNKLGPGAIIEITRSGDVIPYLVSVVKKARKAQMPDISWSWNETGVDITFDDADSDATVAVTRISHFFATIGADGVRYGTLAKLYEDGFDTILKVVKAKVSRMEKIAGIQTTTANNIRNAIDRALAKVTLPQLMDGCGVFGRGLGQTRLEALLRAYPDMMTTSMDKKDLYDMAVAVPTFSDKMATLFALGFPKFMKFYKALGIEAQDKKVVRTVSKKLAGVSVAVTGFRDKALTELIEKNGGQFKDSLGKETTVLLVKQKGSGSSKEKVAAARGIQIFTPQEFLIRYGLQL